MRMYSENRFASDNRFACIARIALRVYLYRQHVYSENRFAVTHPLRCSTISRKNVRQNTHTHSHASAHDARPIPLTHSAAFAYMCGSSAYASTFWHAPSHTQVQDIPCRSTCVTTTGTHHRVKTHVQEGPQGSGLRDPREGPQGPEGQGVSERDQG